MEEKEREELRGAREAEGEEEEGGTDNLDSENDWLKKKNNNKQINEILDENRL